MLGKLGKVKESQLSQEKVSDLIKRQEMITRK